MDLEIYLGVLIQQYKPGPYITNTGVEEKRDGREMTRTDGAPCT
jgi:hypothetical protein